MHITPQKKFGQNFIINVPDKILVPKSPLTKHLLVVEIGPGTGNITSKILTQTHTFIAQKVIENADIYLIEIDNRLVPKLNTLAQKFSTNNLRVHIINQDVLTIDLLNIVHTTLKTSLFILGALPYNISKRIIQWSITQSLRLKDAYPTLKFLPYRFITQVEVALRYIGTIDKKDFLYWSTAPIVCYAKLIKRLLPGNFTPSPKVTSAIIEFLLCPHKLRKLLLLDTSYEELWQKWNEIAQKIRMFYQNRRKTLIATNKKLTIVPNNAIPENIGGKRPEDLTLNEWLSFLKN